MDGSVSYLLSKAFQCFKAGDKERSIRLIKQAQLLDDAAVIYHEVRLPSAPHKRKPKKRRA